MIVDPTCLVCQNALRIEIDLSVQAVGQRATAKRFDVSRQSIQRHIEKGHNADVDESVPNDPPIPVDPQPCTDTATETTQTETRRSKTKTVPLPPPLPEPPEPIKISKALSTIRDYTNRKQYVGLLLRTGQFRGAPTLDQLQGCWPDITMLGLAEIVAQAAMEVDFFRGTRQARRLVAIAKAEKIYSKSMHNDDHKTALRALEYMTKLDGVSAEPDLVNALASSQAWAITARVLQAKFPEAFEAIHGELVAEESRKRQALAPMTMESSQEG